MDKVNETALLTIIIPFLNEGDEVRRTIRSIKETVSGNPHIILINDASTDKYDYKKLAAEEVCLYVSHIERKGVAASRDEGVYISSTPYFLFLDAHMRFYDKGWDIRLIDLLQQYPDSVLCAQTQKMEINEFGEITTPKHRKCYGAYIEMGDNGLFKVNWSYTDPQPSKTCVEIACLLGAAYACSKQYWSHLHGLKGLIYYGSDEELLSTKVWCEGGKCILVKDWVAGHLYRNSFPYVVPPKEMLYNRLFTIELFYPYSIKRQLFLNMQKNYGNSFEEAYELLRSKYNLVKEERKYWSSITKRTVDDFILWNKKIELLQ